MPLVKVQRIAIDVSAVMSVCLSDSLFICLPAYLENHKSKIYKILFHFSSYFFLCLLTVAVTRSSFHNNAIRYKKLL